MTPSSEHRPLTEFTSGACMLIKELSLLPEQAERLRDLGICEGRNCSVLHNADRIIVRCGGCRIGLHHELAQGLRGIPVADEVVDTRLLPSIKRFFASVGLFRRITAPELS